MTWTGEREGDSFGSTVAGYTRGKVTFLMVGAPAAGPNKTGRVYVYDGLVEKPRFILESDATGTAFGYMFMSIPGDLDGDGVPDLYATDFANKAKGPSTGRAYAFSGKTGKNLFTFTGETAGEGFGIGPGPAGDVDGDGRPDLVIGAWQYAGAAVSGGRTYLYSGKDGKLLKTYTCRIPGDTFGFDAVGMGDTDGDGTVDLLDHLRLERHQGEPLGQDPAHLERRGETREVRAGTADPAPTNGLDADLHSNRSAGILPICPHPAPCRCGESRPFLRPVVQRRRIEIGSVRPDERPTLLVDPDLVENLRIRERTEDLACQHGTKVHHLCSPVLETDPEREGGDLLESRDLVDGVGHRIRLTLSNFAATAWQALVKSLTIRSSMSKEPSYSPVFRTSCAFASTRQTSGPRPRVCGST